MSSSLIVLTGPPLPGRWSLARALERRCGARRFSSGAVTDIRAALARGGCVLVDGDLPTMAERDRVLALAPPGQRLLVEWRCGRTEAEREVYHRYASRPPVLANAEFERYLEDVERREPAGGERADGAVVSVGSGQPLDEQVERVVRALGSPEAPAPACGNTRRVMVVEDDPDQRAMLAEVLEELGCSVDLAPDAGVAMALLDDGIDVELLISDHQMPGMTGVELTRELHRRHPHVRTILLTAYGDEDTCRQAVQAHAVTVLAKPLRVMDLERVLDEATTCVG